MVMLRRPTNFSRRKGKYGKEKNVVIFGEAGVGKSSLINLIAGENISETSSSAVGCTLTYKRYVLTLGNQRFAIWDTAGLDEGTEGSVPAEKAEAYLKQLLRDLTKASGIDLLVYCVRGTRVRSALLTNYHLFYSAICRKKVPIAIVITGLENQEGSMETWWLKNESQFSALRMRFNNYACVTTLQSLVENPTLEERRRMSKTAVIKMITDTCRTEQWMPSERNWVETVFPDIRAILSPREGNKVHVANVIMCDVTRSMPVHSTGPGMLKRSITFQNPFTLTRSLTLPISFRSPLAISVVGNTQHKLPFDVSMKCTQERLFRVHQVPQKQTPFGAKEEETKKEDMVVKRGADLLIFCVEKRPGSCKRVKSQWEYFNASYGGDLSPQIVIVIGAVNQESAEEWWNDTVLGGAITRPGDAFISYWPLNESFVEVRAAKERLRTLIHTCCIDCSQANFSGDKRIFGRGTALRVDRGLIPGWARPPRISRTMEITPDRDVDILTKWGVWEHVSGDQGAICQSTMI